LGRKRGRERRECHRVIDFYLCLPEKGGGKGGEAGEKEGHKRGEEIIETTTNFFIIKIYISLSREKKEEKKKKGKEKKKKKETDERREKNE